MSQVQTWNPLTEWRHTDINWVRVQISREDLKRFTKRSDFRGLLYAVTFLLIIVATGAFAYLSFARRWWIPLVVALYVHGTFYSFFGNSLHELSHHTVFRSKWLSVFFTTFFGILYWPYNPHLYRLSHMKFHHQYTLHQGSDGEDVPNYVEITPKFLFELFFRVFHVKSLIHNLYRLFTITPTSRGWRGRGPKLDTWEQFILQRASDRERRQVYRLAVANLVIHTLFTAACIYFGYWFLPIIITFAPFYGAGFLGFMAGIHQHAACEANHPDFRISCGDAILDPLTSFLYWRMEYHLEHHMFAAIPCYRLAAFSRFVADQLPPKERAIPRIRKLNEICKEKYGNRQNWRDRFGIYKGF
jgi:fatty acid desaturase